jgi:hypothetical protein
MSSDRFLWPIIGFVAILAAGYWWMGREAEGFSEADIKAAKLAISAELEKRAGWRVEHVDLIREAPNKLTGFVKILAGRDEFTKSCNVTMADNSRSYVWSCN